MKKGTLSVVCGVLLMCLMVPPAVPAQASVLQVFSYYHLEQGGILKLGLEIHNLEVAHIVARFPYDASNYPRGPFRWLGGEASEGISGGWLGARGGYVEYEGELTVCHDPTKARCRPGYEWVEASFQAQQEGIYTFTLQISSGGVTYEPEPLVVEIRGANTIHSVAECHVGHEYAGNWLNTHLALRVSGYIAIPTGGCWTEVVDVSTGQKVVAIFNGESSVYNGALFEDYVNPINGIGSPMKLESGNLYRIFVFPDDGSHAPDLSRILAMTEVKSPSCMTHTAYLPVVSK